MHIEVRRIMTRYHEVTFQEGNTTIKTEWLNEKESNDVAETLLNAGFDLADEETIKEYITSNWSKEDLLEMFEEEV